MVTAVPLAWIKSLATAVADALHALADAGEALVAVDLGCFPWHGRLELSVLTAAEATANATLLAPDEVAAWERHDFARTSDPWWGTDAFALQMADAYQSAAEGDRGRVVEEFLPARAAAMADPVVTAAAGRHGRTVRHVRHPDTFVEHFTPAAILIDGPPG